MERHTEPDEATQRAERYDAERDHGADRQPTAEEDAAADRELSTLDEAERREVAEHYKEMTETGANIKGEGEIK